MDKIWRIGTSLSTSDIDYYIQNISTFVIFHTDNDKVTSLLPFIQLLFGKPLLDDYVVNDIKKENFKITFNRVSKLLNLDP